MARRRVHWRQMALGYQSELATAGSGIGPMSQCHPTAPKDSEPPYKLIRLYNSRLFAKVDPDLYEALSLIRWRKVSMGPTSPKFYARGSVDGRSVYMHRYIMQCDDPDILIDHRNGDTLDNRRLWNLRESTVLQNNRNRPARDRRGLRWVRSRQQWLVSLTVNRQKVKVGYYDTEIEAMEARRDAEKKYYGFVMRPLDS